jgi:hypothetical protein
MRISDEGPLISWEDVRAVWSGLYGQGCMIRYRKYKPKSSEDVHPQITRPTSTPYYPVAEVEF